MEVLLLLIFTASNALCFFLGARVRQKVDRGEEIKLPSVNPFEAFKAHQEREEAKMEQNRIDTIMRNIEGYDGTSNGQKDVPRG